MGAKYTRLEDWAMVNAAGMDAGTPPLKPWDVPLDAIPIPEVPRDKRLPAGWQLHGKPRRPRGEAVDRKLEELGVRPRRRRR